MWALCVVPVGTERSRKYSLKVFGANATLGFKDFLRLVAKGQEAANSWPDGYAVKQVANDTRAQGAQEIT